MPVHAVATADGATLHDPGIHADVALRMLNSGAQNPTILREVALSKSGHHAPSAGSHDAQTHVVPNVERETDPRLFNHGLVFFARFHDNVGAKARDVETP